jgi:hypothetical protein
VRFAERPQPVYRPATSQVGRRRINGDVVNKQENTGHCLVRRGIGGGRRYQIKDIYIEHRAGKAALLASWRKMTQPSEFCW